MCEYKGYLNFGRLQKGMVCIDQSFGLGTVTP